MCCTLRYLVSGASNGKQERLDLEEDLRASTFEIATITLLPAVKGFTIELELTDLGPFDEKSIEPYIQEHLIASSVQSVFRKRRDEFDVVLQHLKF